ncbi:RHS repeat-associated core domain-containing protein [Burkholderia pyrrocinia]|uniref:RHS repeat-associated core domain-containing protein n=1 Tax=Burkholderia pyrrocinia TaxID=60550 RepID=A0ABZ3BI96_BURPY
MYEPSSFVPVAQAVRDDAIELLDQPEYGDYYRQDEDPLWLPPPPAPAIDSLAWYQCDHLGTPQELTDEQSEIAWSAEYRAWGAVKEVIRKTSDGRVELRNPIRFQGQYHDHETGLHYNRHRYFDYGTGRYLSPDPLGLGGGINVYAYAGGNPVAYYDPLGLKKFGRNHPHCVAIREKITGLQNELDTRWSELVGGLPERIGPGERLAETMRGHRTMINQKDSILRRWEKKYDEDCDDNDPDDGSNACSACPSGSTVVKTAAGVGAAYAAYRAIRMIPSLVPPLWWTIPANAMTP